MNPVIYRGTGRNGMPLFSEQSSSQRAFKPWECAEDSIRLPRSRQQRVESFKPLPEYAPPALVVGFGAIGRGLFGSLFRKNGFRVVGVGRSPHEAKALTEAGAYPVVVESNAQRVVQLVDGVSMVANSSPALPELYGRARVMGLALRTCQLGDAAEDIAGGLRARAREVMRGRASVLPILIALNATDSQHVVAEKLRAPLQAAGLAIIEVRGEKGPRSRLVITTEDGTKVASMVPTVVDRVARIPEQGQAVITEPGGCLAVEAAPIPLLHSVSGVRLVEDLGCCEELKLFVCNAAHALIAYQGACVDGVQYVHQAALDPSIGTSVATFIREEALPALKARWGNRLPEDLCEEYEHFLMQRFANRRLRDPIERVARNPIRKLGPRDRLIGIARICHQHGVPCHNLIRGIAHALLYDPATSKDEQVQMLRRELENRSLKDVLKRVCGLDENQDARLLDAIESAARPLLLQRQLRNVGIEMDTATGEISYCDGFEPIDTQCAVTFVRHGQTEGNIEPRIFQGHVDEPGLNQLTPHGVEQAENAARALSERMHREGWTPDAVLCSPLGRARDTAAAFLRRHPELEDRFGVDPAVREQSFGAWDNRRVQDFPTDSPCHRFYRQQDALVCGEGGECFADVLLRARAWLESLRKPDFAQAGQRPRIVVFSHSMFGAACAILTGQGKQTRRGNLGFDGQYTLPHAQPFDLAPLGQDRVDQAVEVSSGCEESAR